MVTLDVGDRAIELALEAAPVRNIEQEVGIGRGCSSSIRAIARANCALSRRIVNLAS